MTAEIIHSCSVPGPTRLIQVTSLGGIIRGRSDLVHSKQPTSYPTIPRSPSPQPVMMRASLREFAIVSIACKSFTISWPQIENINSS